MNKRNVSIALLVFTLVVLGGCSKLGKTVECIDDVYGKLTITVVGETNKRVLGEYSYGGFKIYERSERNNRSNCSTKKEDTPPKMLSGYEHLSGHFK